MDRRKEMSEAIRAGEEVLNALDELLDKLKSSKNWGWVDILGGSFITSLIKRSKISDANSLALSAQAKLRRFQDELEDVEDQVDFRVDVSELLTFGDIFFDNAIFDIMVQSKIGDSIQKVETTRREVEAIVALLRKDASL